MDEPGTHYVKGTWITSTGERVTGEFVTIAGLAAELGFSNTSTVHHHKHKGHIRYHKVGRRYLISLSEVRRLKRLRKQLRSNQEWPVVAPPDDTPE